MKYHKVDIQGKYWLEEVGSLPTWLPGLPPSGSEGRIMYVTNLDTMVFGGTSEFIPFYNIQKITVTGQPDIILNDPYDVITLEEGTGITITTSAGSQSVSMSIANNFGKLNDINSTIPQDTLIINGANGISVYVPSSPPKAVEVQSSNSFGSVDVPNQTQATVSATQTNDTLTFVPSASSGIHIGVNDITKTLTFSLDPGFLSAKIWIYHDTAPAGWSIVSGTTDALLGVFVGSSQSGTWSWAGATHTHTGGAHHITVSSQHTHTVPPHKHYILGANLTISNLPDHTHGVLEYSGDWGSGNGYVARKDYYSSQQQRTVLSYPQSAPGQPYLGAGSSSPAHDHGYTSQEGTDTSTSAGDGTGADFSASLSYSATPSTWRPMAAIGIIVQKI